MAFFDEIGKKISIVSQDAIEKTKNATNSAKINSAIADENRIIEDCFTKIGELFYNYYGCSDNSDIQHQINIVKHSQANIKNFQTQLLELKGVVICPSCSSEVSVGAAFCSNCGSKMPIEENKDLEDNTSRCPNCNTIIDTDLNFCTNCGTKLK